MMHYFKKISFYTISFLILSSCSVYKKVGTYTYATDGRNETLILNKDVTFISRPITSPVIDNIRRCVPLFSFISVFGEGNYHVKNDSIYLNLKRGGFEYPKDNIRMRTTAHQNETTKLKFHFDEIYDNIKILYKGKEVAKSGFEDILVEIDAVNYPIALTIDFSGSEYSFFKNYTFKLDKVGDYEIDFSTESPHMHAKDLVFPISNHKGNIQIGRMKHSL